MVCEITNENKNKLRQNGPTPEIVLNCQLTKA